MHQDASSYQLQHSWDEFFHVFSSGSLMGKQWKTSEIGHFTFQFSVFSSSYDSSDPVALPSAERWTADEELDGDPDGRLHQSWDHAEARYLPNHPSRRPSWVLKPMVFGGSPIVEKPPDYGLVMTCPRMEYIGISTNCHCRHFGML